MNEIITITMSPAVDKSSVSPMILPDKKLRCTDPVFEPGGGGINVARAIKKLGGQALAIYPAGGHTGVLMQELLSIENVTQTVFPIANWTRENFIVVNKSTKEQYRFGFPGAEMSAKEVGQFLELLKNLNPTPKYLVLSGSMPPGVPDDFCASIAQIAKNYGAKLVIDTSGEALSQALEVGVYLIKPNINELGALTGVDEPENDQVEAMAREFITKGKCEIMVVSLGPAGAMMVTADECIHIPAPAVPRRSTVGAGDSMVAGIVLSLASGKTPREAVCYGVASGSAATMNNGTALCKKEDADKLYEWILHHVS